MDNALFNPHVIVLSFIYLNIFEDDCPVCPVYPLYHNYTRAVDITEYCIAIAECPSDGGDGAGTLGILRVVWRRMTFLNPQATSRQQPQQPPTELVPDTMIEPH